MDFFKRYLFIKLIFANKIKTEVTMQTAIAEWYPMSGWGFFVLF